jgi:hypothetical protein
MPGSWYPLDARPIEVTPHGLESASGGEAAHACENFKPRYGHNPAHWLGGNHDRYGDVLNCHWEKHYGMPGKSTVNRRIELSSCRPGACTFCQPSAAIS